jgi:6,7-dimethyl-8-ribityllumazine synthase
MAVIVNGDSAKVSGAVGIAVSRYNDNITSKLLQGAIATLSSHGIAESKIMVVWAPGAWELPLLCQDLIAQPQISAVIGLGCVIRGETTHDQHINRAVSMAMMDLSLKHSKPVAFGLLTCNTLEQAIHRSGGRVGNKGDEAAGAIIEMLKVRSQLAQSAI